MSSFEIELDNLQENVDFFLTMLAIKPKAVIQFLVHYFVVMMK